MDEEEVTSFGAGDGSIVGVGTSSAAQPRSASASSTVMEGPEELVIGTVGSLVRSSLDIAETNPYAGSDDVTSAAVTSFDLNNSSVTEQESVNASLDISATSVLELETIPPSRPYAVVADFGRCEFPPGSDDVIVDYWSGPLNEDFQVENEFEREFGVTTGSRNDDNESDEEEQTHEGSEDSKGASPPSKHTSKEQGQIAKFFSSDCCEWMCNREFERDLIETVREDSIENDYFCPDHVNHLHVSIIGQLSALSITEEDVTNRDGKLSQRSRATTVFMFRGYEVCRKFFLFVNNCGRSRFMELTAQLKTAGNQAKLHGNVGRMPSNTTKSEKIVQFRTFLLNYCDVHALVLPGRTPYFDPKNSDLKILPSSMTKESIYKIYSSTCEDPFSKTSFLRFWNAIFPNVVIQKPRTDLCPECYKMTTSLSKLHGLSEDEKAARLEKSLEHLNRVKEERQVYRDATLRLEVTRELSASEPCSFHGRMHYSFDFAQQVFLPYDSQQVGPLYFLTPYKVSLFGIACEPLGKFVLYMIPESLFSVGKGSNVVISLFHHFLETFGQGEEDIHIHADNCAGQNKNNYLLQYAAWRVSCGLHKSFQISFLPVGHTKFAPDLNFGHVKKAYRRSSVNSLQELKKAIVKSCGNFITPFIVGDEQGKTSLKFYDWQKFFKMKKAEKVPRILENFHFKVSSEDAEDSEFHREDLPPELPVQPMDPLRRKYLNEQIRPFVSDECKEILCPAVIEEEIVVPAIAHGEIHQAFALPGSSRQLVPSRMDQNTKLSGIKRVNKCGYCHQEGHTNRVNKNGVPSCPVRLQDESISQIATVEENSDD